MLQVTEVEGPRCSLTILISRKLQIQKGTEMASRTLSSLPQKRPLRNIWCFLYSQVGHDGWEIGKELAVRGCLTKDMNASIVPRA